nr:immunoglobulin heavy chain junction region [Macaca mulatta]
CARGRYEDDNGYYVRFDVW